MVTSLFASAGAAGHVLSVGSPAPQFETDSSDGTLFRLKDRIGHWTALYFYPKDDTPGCTQQACAFRDGIDVIRKQGAEVHGVSKDTIESHKKFTEKYKLNFPLLADPEGKIIRMYGISGVFGYAKRWTFLIGPDLVIRVIQKDVDPMMNAKSVAAELEKAKGTLHGR